MKDKTEHTCQFCYYEYFDSRAYPCSMCVCGERREDMFQPKGRQNKRKTEQTDCERCAEYGSYKCTKCDGEMYYKPQTETEWLQREGEF